MIVMSEMYLSKDVDRRIVSLFLSGENEDWQVSICLVKIALEYII